MDPKITGDFIASLRKEKGLTQKQLAEKLNVSDKAISRWETGRGYPDVESLQALSSEFSVSINELLYGERIRNEITEKKADDSIALAYIETSTKKRRLLRLAVCLAALFILVNSMNIVYLIHKTFVGTALYKDIMGSSNCTVASDYSYLTFFGQKYIPFVTDDTECALSVCVIEEAQVENMPFIGKLLFGEKVYSVKGCSNYEILYLQTDEDFLASKYYCLESKTDYYLEILKNEPYDTMTAQIISKDWNINDLRLSDDLTEMLTASDHTVSSEVNCSWSRGDGDESITVHAAQAEGPFRKEVGELLKKQGEYYFFDYKDIPADKNNGDYTDIKAHELDDSYDEALDLLFSYMFN